MAPPQSNANYRTGQPAARQRPKSPSRVLAEAEEQWLFSEEELAHTPSIQDGMSAEKERELRAKGVNFIRQVGIMLKLPELTLSTAVIFFHRFLMRVTLVDKPGAKALHHYTLGGTALFLASKVEECCRKMKDIVIACCRVAQKNPNLLVDEQSKDFWRWRDTILANEDVLLEVLCFDLTVEAPHRQLFSMMKQYDVANMKPLRNAAWAFVTDSFATELCILCSSRTIAAAALYAGARMCDVRLPDGENGRPWWEAQHVRLKDMIKAANYMALTYEHNPAQNGTGTGADGGQSIYVGLFTDLDALVVDDEEPKWERTRLKSDQGISTPLQPVLDLEPRKGGSVSSQGSKRVRDLLDGDGRIEDRGAATNGQAAVKKRRLSPPQETNGNGSEMRIKGAAMAVREKEDASEEGELEE